MFREPVLAEGAVCHHVLCIEVVAGGTDLRFKQVVTWLGYETSRHGHHSLAAHSRNVAAEQDSLPHGCIPVDHEAAAEAGKFTQSTLLDLVAGGARDPIPGQLMERVLRVEEAVLAEDRAFATGKYIAGMGHGHMAGAAFGLDGLIVSWKTGQVH